MLYPAAQPEKAAIDSFFELWGVALIVGGIGVFDCLLGLALLGLASLLKKYQRQPPPLGAA